MNEKKHTLQFHSDVYIGITLIVISLFACIQANSFPEAARRFPIIASVLMIVLSVVLIVRGVYRGRVINKNEKEIKKLLPWSSTKYALCTFLLTAGYIFIMENVDFFLATVIFVPAMMVFMRVKKIWVIAISTAGITLFCWFMFVYQLNIRMP